MSEQLTLEAAKREKTGRNAVAVMRSEGGVPAVVYGPEMEAQPISIQPTAFDRVYANAGESTLVDLVVDGGQPVKVLIHDVQRDPLKHTVSHVDFRQINMSEKVHAEVELVFEGEAPAVKSLGGILVKNIDHIEIECLPTDLPHHIVVDLTTLAEFHSSVYVKDLKIPEGVTVLAEDDVAVVTVSEPRSEAELEALDEEVNEDVSSVEVEGAKEGEEAAEGESQEDGEKKEGGESKE